MEGRPFKKKRVIVSIRNLNLSILTVPRVETEVRRDLAGAVPMESPRKRTTGR
jgi:hypothetical protein